MHATDKEMQRFNQKWIKSGDCHLWLGALDSDGYGTFYFRQKNRRAHRVGWFISHGAVGNDLVINHTCRNRHCVNPQHLQRVTQTVNALKDSCSIAYINSQKTQCKRGHDYDRLRIKPNGRTERGCSICEAEKHRRLRAKWRAQDTLQV